MKSATPSVETLKRAIAISEQIESLQNELAAILGGRAVKVKKGAKASAGATPEATKAAKSTKAPKKKRAKRVLSPEARQRIIEAQKRRWAKQRKTTAPAK